MAIERQKTFKTNVTKSIEKEVEAFLRECAVDPAAIQIYIDNGNGVKAATVTYGERGLLKALYEQQGRTYSESDAVTYCHVKDFVTELNNDLDETVNNFIADENIGVVSISRYFSQINQGAFIFYIDLVEQKAKMEEKQKELAKAREELAQKLASTAVKDVDLEKNDVVDKYSAELQPETTSVDSSKNKSGLTQTKDLELTSNVSTTITANSDKKAEVTINNNENVTLQDNKKPEKKKKFFGNK